MTTIISDNRDTATSMEAKTSPTHQRRKGTPQNAHLNPHSSLRSHSAAFLNTRARATSMGSAPLLIPQSPRAGFRPLSLSPARANRKSALAFVAPSLLTEPPRISDTQKAMEHVLQQERKRSKEMEKAELSMPADELRIVLQQERRRMSGYAADLARLKSAAVQCQAESEIHEERCINGLMRQLESLQVEKGRIIVELEREEEMLTNTLQKKLNKVRKEKAALEKLIEKEKVEHQELERKVAQLQGTGSIETQLQAEKSISGATALKDEPLSELGAGTEIPGEEEEEEDAPIPR